MRERFKQVSFECAGFSAATYPIGLTERRKGAIERKDSASRVFLRTYVHPPHTPEDRGRRCHCRTRLAVDFAMIQPKLFAMLFNCG